MASLGKDVTARSSAGHSTATTTEDDVAQPILWAGIDAGKAAHHCVAINADGQRVLSRRVVNDEDALRDLIRAVKAVADGGAVRWAIDLNSGGAALLITLLLDDDQELLYIPGRVVHHASGAYRGDGKTVLLTALTAPPDEVWALGG